MGETLEIPASTNPAKETLLSDLSDHRDDNGRPIIFIGHSLGGIVIKTYYCAWLYFVSCSNFDSVRSLVFFGTPHQGSDGAVWLKFIGGLSSGLHLWTTTKVVEELKTWSIPLVELTTNFSELAPNFAITTFYEEQDTYGVRVVNEGSARLGQRNERIVGLAANHFQICKFATETESNYRRVLSRLEAIVRALSAPIRIPTSIAEPEQSSQGEDLQRRFDELTVPTGEPA